MITVVKCLVKNSARGDPDVHTIVKVYLPASASLSAFMFELRSSASGQAFPQSMFDHQDVERNLRRNVSDIDGKKIVGC